MDNKGVTYVRCLKCKKILQCSRYDTSTLLQHIRTDHPEVEIVQSDSKDEVTNNQKANKSNTRRQDQTKGKLKSEQRKNIESKERLQQTNEHEEQIPLLCEWRDHELEDEMPTNYNEESGHPTAHGVEDKNSNKYKLEPDLISGSEETHFKITSDLGEKYPEIKENEFRSKNPKANVLYTKRLKLKTPSTTSVVSITPRSPQKRNMYRTTIEKWRPATGTIYCPQCGSNKRPLIKTCRDKITQNQCFACCLFSCWPFCFLPCLAPQHEMEYLYCSNCKAFLGLFNRHLNCIRPNKQFVACLEETSPNNPKLNAHPNNSSKKSHKQQLPSIVIDGKELHPDMVARLQRFRKYGHLAGIDLDAVLSDDNRSEHSPLMGDSFRDDDVIHGQGRKMGGRRTPHGAD